LTPLLVHKLAPISTLTRVKSQFIASSKYSPQMWILRESTCNGSESANQGFRCPHALFMTLSALVVSSDWLFSRYDYVRQSWQLALRCYPVIQTRKS